MKVKSLTAIILASSIAVSSMIIEKNFHPIETAELTAYRLIGGKYSNTSYKKPFLNTKLSFDKKTKFINLEVKIDGEYISIKERNHKIILKSYEYELNSIPKDKIAHYIVENYSSLSKNDKETILVGSLLYYKSVLETSVKRKYSLYLTKILHFLKSLKVP